MVGDSEISLVQRIFLRKVVRPISVSPTPLSLSSNKLTKGTKAPTAKSEASPYICPGLYTGHYKARRAAKDQCNKKFTVYSGSLQKAGGIMLLSHQAFDTHSTP